MLRLEGSLLQTNLGDQLAVQLNSNYFTLGHIHSDRVQYISTQSILCVFLGIDSDSRDCLVINYYTVINTKSICYVPVIAPFAYKAAVSCYSDITTIIVAIIHYATSSISR